MNDSCAPLNPSRAPSARPPPSSLVLGLEVAEMLALLYSYQSIVQVYSAQTSIYLFEPSA